MRPIKVIIAILLIFSIANIAKAQTDLKLQTILEKQVTIKVPKGFKELSLEEINQKFARGRRPNVVFSNESGTVSLTLDLKETQISQDDLPKYQKNYGYMFNQYLIDKTKNSNDIIIINKHNVGFFKLRMPTVNGMSYALMIYTNIGNQMLIATFYCPIKEQKKWESIANEILKSLIVKEK